MDGRMVRRGALAGNGAADIVPTPSRCLQFAALHVDSRNDETLSVAPGKMTSLSPPAGSGNPPCWPNDVPLNALVANRRPMGMEAEDKQAGEGDAGTGSYEEWPAVVLLRTRGRAPAAAAVFGPAVVNTAARAGTKSDRGDETLSIPQSANMSMTSISRGGVASAEASPRPCSGYAGCRRRSPGRTQTSQSIPPESKPQNHGRHSRFLGKVASAEAPRRRDSPSEYRHRASTKQQNPPDSHLRNHVHDSHLAKGVKSAEAPPRLCSGCAGRRRRSPGRSQAPCRTPPES